MALLRSDILNKDLVEQVLKKIEVRFIYSIFFAIYNIQEEQDF